MCDRDSDVQHLNVKKLQIRSKTVFEIDAIAKPNKKPKSQEIKQDMGNITTSFCTFLVRFKTQSYVFAFINQKNNPR